MKKIFKSKARLVPALAQTSDFQGCLLMVLEVFSPSAKLNSWHPNTPYQLLIWRPSDSLQHHRVQARRAGGRLRRQLWPAARRGGGCQVSTWHNFTLMPRVLKELVVELARMEQKPPLELIKVGWLFPHFASNFHNSAIICLLFDYSLSPSLPSLRSRWPAPRPP